MRYLLAQLELAEHQTKKANTAGKPPSAAIRPQTVKGLYPAIMTFSRTNITPWQALTAYQAQKAEKEQNVEKA